MTKKRPIIDESLHADLKDLQLIEMGINMADKLEISNPAFNHAMNKAKTAIESEKKAHQKSMEPSKKFKEYLDKRVKICEEYAQKEFDKKGKEKPVIESPIENALGQDFVINPEKLDEFKEKMSALEKQYTKEIKARKNFTAKEDDLLSAKRDFRIYKVIPEHVPEVITLGVMTAVFKLIAHKKPAAKTLKSFRLTKEKILNINSLVTSLESIDKPKSFVEKMAFNFWAIKEQADALYEEKPYLDYAKAEKERNDLSEKHSVKYRHNGEAILYGENGKNFFYIENQDAFNEDLQKLQNKNEAVYETYAKWLEEEVTVKGRSVSFDEIPEMKRYQSEAIQEFVEI